MGETSVTLTASDARRDDKSNNNGNGDSMAHATAEVLGETGAYEIGNGEMEQAASSTDGNKEKVDAPEPHQSHTTSQPRPPLPPRPSLLHVRGHPTTFATTAVSSVEIQTLTFPDGSRGTFTSAVDNDTFHDTGGNRGSRHRGHHASIEPRDDASVMSYTPATNEGDDLNSLLNDGLSTHSPAWRLLNSQTSGGNAFELSGEQDISLANFDTEFEELTPVTDGNEDDTLLQWKSKLKHYLILSSAGKPIYSRHGDQNLINGYVGIVQTIMSFFQGSRDTLLGFTAGETRFVAITQGPLYLMAISRLKESDFQMRSQLEALYMQVLSTLTLPNLTHMFTSRPNTDLRRPLEGTDSLLSSLADTFTKGSPTTLLSALECLKLRKSERHLIDSTLLKARTDNLLYGLVVAGGRLVSVARPKRHSLHPNDLQLIFNMLFEAGSVRAGGGENWIPLCLPGFNNRGFLYMYVSFLGRGEVPDEACDLPTFETANDRSDDVAILLIGGDKESFFELKTMRDEVVAELYRNGSMKVITAAVRQGRPTIADIAPGLPIRHFIYKSRANVQFFTPSFTPLFTDLLARRKLFSVYQNLHASAHAKHNHLKVLHCVNRDSVSLAWITPLFEFYCVAGPNVSRAALAQGANKAIQWMKREEQRIFIFGGAVF